MAQKVCLHVRRGSENDIREALDDILSSGLIDRITDEQGNSLSLDVVTAVSAPKEKAALPAAPRARQFTVTELARKSTARNGIAQITAMTQASRGEGETCLGQRVTLTDQGGGKEELLRQHFQALWGMNQPRIFMMELPGRTVIEGSGSPWYPFGKR